MGYDELPAAIKNAVEELARPHGGVVDASVQDCGATILIEASTASGHYHIGPVELPKDLLGA